MSEAFALPTDSAPAPANSAIASFLMGSSWFVAILPSGIKALPLFFVPQVLEGERCELTGRRVPLPVNGPIGATDWNSARHGRLFFPVLRPTPKERTMKERLLITTAIGLMLGTAAF